LRPHCFQSRIIRPYITPAAEVSSLNEETFIVTIAWYCRLLLYRPTYKRALRHVTQFLSDFEEGIDTEGFEQRALLFLRKVVLSVLSAV
jgi:hypothetical protein